MILKLNKKKMTKVGFDILDLIAKSELSKYESKIILENLIKSIDEVKD